MENTFGCGNDAALVSYLYDECEPREREAITAHLTTCPACTAELQALQDTRRMLPAWTPPNAALDFRITSGEFSGAHVLRPPRWWQRPLPGWAQAAAALVIFAAGFAAGGRGDAGAPATASFPETRTVDIRAASPAVPAGGVSRDDLARLERELRGEIARISQAQREAEASLQRASTAPAPAAIAGGLVTMEQVDALIEDSERRQYSQLLWAMGEVVADIEARQLRTLTPVKEAVAGLGREAEINRGSVQALGNAMSALGGFRLVGGNR